MTSGGWQGHRAWLTAAMLFLFMLINFADKAVLGLSAVPVMRELGLNHTQFGLIGTSFFVFFSMAAVCAGFLANRIATKWMLAAMALIWSLCQIPMLLAVGLPALIANRVVLGLGEGPAYPVALHAAYKWFPDDRRPLPTSLIAIGAAIGTGIVAPAIVYVILTYSWHAAFGLLGAIGLVWCVVWVLFGREGPLVTDGEEGAVRNQRRVPYSQLLTYPTVIGCVLIGFSAYWLLTIAVVWLPVYLEKGLGYSPTQAGWIVTLPPLCQIVLMPSICRISELLKGRGASSRLSRGFLSAVSVLIAGSMTVLLPLSHGPVLPILCTTLAFSVGSLIFCLGPVMLAELTPVRQRGAMLGTYNAIVTLAGPLAPVCMGSIIDTGANVPDGFRIAFIVAGSCVAAGALVSLALINPEEDLRKRVQRGAVERAGGFAEGELHLTSVAGRHLPNLHSCPAACRAVYPDRQDRPG
jgi:ACS family D-galactonate transporter-like MFS transporter